MGLFGSDKRKAAKTPARRSSGHTMPMQVYSGVRKPFELPEGDNDGFIYTFDARPLGKLRKGQKVRMVLVRGDYDMYDIYSDEIVVSRQYENTNCCLTYNGYAIGCLTGMRTYIQKLVDKYGAVSVLVRYDGPNKHHGVPEFWALLPDRQWFMEELGIKETHAGWRNHKNEDPNAVTLRIYNDEWPYELQNGEHELKLNVLPTPKGSKAKPHIEVMIDGVVCSEITAKHGCYKALESLVGADVERCTISTTISDEGLVTHLLKVRRRS